MRLAEARDCPKCNILSHHGRITGPSRCETTNKRNRQSGAAYFLQLYSTGINSNIVRVRWTEFPSIVRRQHRQPSASAEGPAEYRSCSRPEKSWPRSVRAASSFYSSFFLVFTLSFIICAWLVVAYSIICLLCNIFARGICVRIAFAER